MSKLATVSFKNAQGHTATGEFVCETSGAWQVAVNGKVQLFDKSEWTSIVNPSPAGGFDFGSLFGGRS